MKAITLSIGIWLATISIALAMQGDGKSVIWIVLVFVLVIFVGLVEGGDRLRTL